MHISDILIPLPFVTVMERDGKLVEEPSDYHHQTGGRLWAQVVENNGAGFSNAMRLPDRPDLSNVRAKGEQRVSNVEFDYPEKSMGSAPTPVTLRRLL